MKYVNLLILIVLIPFWSFSQSNFKAGYVITLNGDTIKGFIDYRGWDNNPKSINFKDNLTSSTIKRYTINNINYFSISNIESYQKFIGSISTDEINIERLSGSRDTSFKIDTVFLKILQKGKNISLYQYSDEIKTRYFYGEYPDYKPKELIYKVYNNNDVEKYQLQNKKTIVDDTYLKQLFAMALKYNTLDDDLSRLFNSGEYKDYYLLDIATKINQIKAIDVDKSYNPKISFFAGAGLNIANIYPYENSQYVYEGGKSHTSFLPLISTGINCIPNPKSEKVELRLEILLSTATFDSGIYPSEDTYFNQINVILMPQVIFNFYRANNYKIFAGGGLALNHYIFYNSHYQTYYYLSNSYYNGFTVGSLFLKVGVKTSKRLAFYLNFFTDNIISSFDNFYLSINTTHLGFLYFFGK